MVIYKTCNEKIRKIIEAHLRYKHSLNTVELARKYTNFNRSMIPWNKGKTKFTHPSVLKISKTMRAKPESNFANWQKLKKKRLHHKIRKSKHLAELIGIILGDGCIEQFPRTERLVITCNKFQTLYIKHIHGLTKKIFHKNPSLRARKRENAVDVSLYQCDISKKIGMPSGNKIKNNVGIPNWIYQSKKYMIACLKGLFETDGCFQRDDANYAQSIEVTNKCRQLRNDIYKTLLLLGYNPQLGKTYVRLARRHEVYKFKASIDFRKY